MSKIRPITWIGFSLSVLAVAALFVNPVLAVCLGAIGAILSIFAVVSAGD